MLPKQLTIQGLYSYQEKQTIDFTRLTEAGIFGIFGVVGSGKSSILEAISFALYGKTERLNDRENRNYNMMNLKSNELLIDFEFEHHDHAIYRFTVRGKRNSKRFHDVKTFDRNAYKLENGAWIPLESADATSILDLSYDNFKRTIIIPQGKFQEFLQLGNTDRTRMMMDIFHLHKYDLSDKVKNLELENELQTERLKGRLQSFDKDNEEALTARQAQLLEIRSQAKELQSNIEQQDAVFQALSKTKEQFDTLKQYKIDYQALEKQKDSFEKRQKTLESFQLAKLYFEPDLLRKKSLTDAMQKRDDELQNARTLLEKLNADIETQSQYWQAVQHDYAQLDIWRQQVQDFQLAQDILHFQLQANTLQEKIIVGKNYITKEEQNKDQISLQCAELETILEQKKANQPDNIFIFQEAGEWFQQQKNYLKQLADIRRQRALLQERIIKEKELFPALSLHFDNWQADVEMRKAQYKKTADDLQDKKNKFSLKAELHQYAKNLQAGQPCPLCGSVHHPDKLEDDETVSQELLTIENALAANNRSLSILELNIAKATRYASEITTCEEQITMLAGNITQLEKAIQEHEAGFHWKEFEQGNENDFLKKKQIAEKNISEISELETSLSAFTKQLNSAKERLNKYRHALTERLAQYNAATENAQKLSTRLQSISPDEIDRYDSTQYTLKKTTLEDKIAQTTAQYDSLQKRLQELDKNKAVLMTTIRSMQSEKEKNREEWFTIHSRIEQLLQKYQIDSEQNVWSILQQKIDIETENTAIRQYQNHLFAAHQKLQLLETQLYGKSFDEIQWAQYNEELIIAKESLARYTAAIAQLDQSIEQLCNNLNTKKELEKQLHEKIIRRENIQILKNLFAGSGFVNYISSAYLKNLCLAANDRFSKLTHNQLHLELNENNEFQIRDLLNEGKTRSAKTLSGGQTFQASLSLALALADSVQYQNKSKQNFFFLDEGFGSLDKNALTTIYDTLKSLRKENRIVGIISHVEDLQQEIPVSLFIENESEKGSQIHFQMN